MASSFDTNPSQGQRQGNLQTVLTSYNVAAAAAAQEASAGAQPSVSDSSEYAGGGMMSDGEGGGGQLDFRDRSNTLGSLGIGLDFRDRSSTLGSAADVVADCLGPFVVDPSPPGPVGLSGGPVPAGQPVPTAGVDGAANANVAAASAAGSAAAHASSGHQPMPRPPAFPGMCHINYDADGASASASASAATSSSSSAQQAASQQGRQHHTGQGNGSQPSSNGSTSGFLSGSFGTAMAQHDAGGQLQHHQHAILGAGGQAQQHQLQQQQMVAHTPPSALGPASYEAKHFGKRMRAGSISGRLRSASDLEDRGIIDRNQKGIIKDLIISGDDALQAALDRYEQGDTAELETMIKSGRLQAYQSENNIDILGDLDLDFLTVDDDFGALSGGDIAVGDHPHDQQDVHPTVVPSSSAYGSSSGGDDVLQGQAQAQAPSSHHQQPAPSTSAYVDDGIGDLEFNADYVNTEEELNLPTDDVHPQQVQQEGRGGATKGTPAQPAQQPPHPHPGAPTTTEGRWRANSLAFGGLLDEAPQQQSSTFANWMDNMPPGMGGDSGERRGLAAVSSSKIVGANGALYIINKDGKAPDRTKSEIKMTASTINRLEQAAERKREKELKKEAREREKVEKRERREREIREKKEREAREKQERKEKKEAAARARRDEKSRRRSLSPKRESKLETRGQERIGSDNEGERKETPSGLGLPRSMSDPNLTVGLDSEGLLQIDTPEGWVGAYSPDSRKIRIERFLAKRNHRVWTKKVKYDVRKNFADSRLRVKGRFVKKEDELLMRDLMSLT